MKRHIQALGIVTSFLFIPLVALAQTSRLEEILFNIQLFILRPLIGLMFVVAMIVFAWGVIEWIYGADSEDKVARGKRNAIYGIIGFVIMAGVWAILNTLCVFIGAC
ncbi:hypothetical protein CL654_01695 [bacterium]|nr:hypothetical protein [bacterium]|tara:strand:- start:14968 stop:15288 length:321 start_codon:yes stop_codon:yes gene_type:complete